MLQYQGMILTSCKLLKRRSLPYIGLKA